MNKQEIHFSHGRWAQAVMPPVRTNVHDIVHALAILPPKAVILITGGASNMEKVVHPNLQRLFTDGLAHAAGALDALIIDGGTDAGVMALIGQGAAKQQHKPTLLGISPAGKVTYPGKTAEKPDSDIGPLDPNHSYFVLVDTDEWGGETEIMYALAKSFSAGRPSVAVLVNGGAIAKNEVLYNVRQQRPIIVIEGSGRLADEIAGIRRGQASMSSGIDPDLAEITMEGDLHLFPLTGSAQELEQLIFSLLQ